MQGDTPCGAPMFTGLTVALRGQNGLRIRRGSAADRDEGGAYVIIQDETQLTAAVLAETERAGDPRVKEITQALVRHLHGFVREVRLTEKEFDAVIAIAAKAVSRTGADCAAAV
ncbi:dioxygenase [Streptomyces sp. NPDC102476]|uniref:dioxygenase n=1 Tax=Streptomyces sp. NPDC102476 TaxID=3366181 RepID=UPI00382D638E